MMKKVITWSVAAILLGFSTACSDKGEITPTEETETGTLAFSISFGKSMSSREDGGTSSTELPGNTNTGSEPTQAISNAIPVTSWDNIQSLQIFLYDRLGVIFFSDYIDAQRIRATLEADPTNSGTVTYTYANVPAGYYTLSCIANANRDRADINTYIGTREVTWDADNVLNNYIYQCQIKHKRSAFPLFYTNQVLASGIVRNETAFAEPSEMFLGIGEQGGSSDITVQAGRTVNANVELTRCVSLMRLRADLDGSDELSNNADVNLNPNGKVDFSRNASIMLATLPEYIIPSNEDFVASDGHKYYHGTSPTSIQSAVIVTNALDGTRQFSAVNPTTGYNEGGKVINIEGDPFNANNWRDIIVMPNDAARQLNETQAVMRQNRYLLIISAMGLPGHITRQGPLTEEKTVYWVGYINEPFEANKIREVNIIFRDGGTEELPERPDNVGNLTVTVSEPKAWDSNVQASKIEL